MGCGSSGQVHDVNSPMQVQAKGSKSEKKQETNWMSQSKCYLFGQSSGQRKVISYNATKQYFTTISSRIRIPIPKIKLQPIQVLYEQSQQIILPDLMRKQPNPPFNFMFGAFCRKDVIFLCGGLSYEGDHVYSEAYFYNLNPGQSKSKSAISNSSTVSTTKTYIKFQPVAGMASKRYSHMGVYFNDTESKKQFIYIFGGKNGQHEPLETCQRFDLTTRKWRDMSSMFSSRAQGSAILFLNNIYVFGGVSQFRQYPQNIEVYNIKTDTWSMLNIRLHRGIRSCLILSDKPNQLLIFGGITALDQEEFKLSSVIRVNLVLETHHWETNLPEKISNVKHVHEKQEQKVNIFSNQNNLIYSYDLVSKSWKNLVNGYKNYVPVGDLKGFACITEGLELYFQLQSSRQQQLASETVGNGLQRFFIMGNQNYPCLLSIIQNKNTLTLKMKQISMKLHLKSNMSIVPTEFGYFICGGCDCNSRHSKNEAFLYSPKAPIARSIQELLSMKESRNLAGIAYVNGNVCVFGGKNKKNVLKSCQRYSFKTKSWQTSGKPLIKPLFSTKTHILQYQPDKILIYGGREQNGNFSTLIQIYDGQINEVISYSQFPVLCESHTSSILIQKANPNEIKKLDLEQVQHMLQISQFYSNRSSMEKQQLDQNYSSSQSMKKPDKINVSKVGSNAVDKMKNLAVENIPAQYRSQNARYQSSQVQKQGVIQKQVQMNKITEVKASPIYINPSKTEKVKPAIQIVPINEASNETVAPKSKITDDLHEDPKSPILEEDQQKVQFIPLVNESIAKKQDQEKINEPNNDQEQPSSQSLLTAQKNVMVSARDNFPSIEEQYEVLKVYVFYSEGEESPKKNSGLRCQAFSTYFLLIQKKSHKISLVKTPLTSLVKLSQPFQHTHSFKLQGQKLSKKHFFANLIDPALNHRLDIFAVDKNNGEVERLAVDIGNLGKQGLEFTGFSIPQYFD